MNVEFINDNDEIVKRTRVVASMKYYTKVAVAGCEISRGNLIDIDDVIMKKADITGIEDYFTSLSVLEGMQPKRTLKEGKIITGPDVRPVYVVKRGDNVKIRIQEGDFLLYTEGTARGNGAKSEFIKVYVKMTKTTEQIYLILSGLVLCP